MIRIAVVEDNEQERTLLTDDLKRYEQENGQHFQITTFRDGLDLVENYSGIYQLIFLDIQMQWMDGMRTAREIRKKDADTVIIFVTNLPQFAADGYDVDARAFLIKPVSYHVLSRQLDKFCSGLEQEETEFLLLSNSREMQRISLRSIYYIETDGHFIDIHTSHTTIHVHIPLRSVEEKLDPHRFVRCNSGTIVNLEHVENIKGHDVVVAGVTLQVSRSSKKPLMDALADYLGGRKQW